MSASTSGSSRDGDAAYEQDRERYWRRTAEEDEQLKQPPSAFQSRAPLHSGQSMREVYTQCADEVVVLSKCVKEEGPMWWTRCSNQFLDLQRCYDAHRSWRDPNPDAIIQGFKQLKEGLSEAWDRYWGQTGATGKTS